MKASLKKTHGANVYSQWGEDGIIAKIFELIGEGDRIAIEFGAWDGFHLSNTANLWAKKNWKGILIEGDASRHLSLIENVKDYDCLPLHGFVEPDGINSLESILERNGVGLRADLLSIDIDSNDYDIFASLKALKPRVVICEYNPTIPVFLDVRAKSGSDNFFGCSAKSLFMLGEAKGYSLVAMTDTNCIFVLREYAAKFEPYELRIENIAPTQYYNYVITDYSGRAYHYGGFCYGDRSGLREQQFEGTDSKLTPVSYQAVVEPDPDLNGASNPNKIALETPCVGRLNKAVKRAVSRFFAH